MQLLTEKYSLTPAQQSWIFPVIARATPAAAQLATAAGEPLTAESLSSLDISIKPEDWTYEPAPDPISAETDATLLAENESEDATPNRTARKPTPGSADTDFEEALTASLESLESQLAPFLNSEQLAAMDEEQIDRLYWWGEILLQISDEIDDDAAIAAAALESDAGTAGDSDPSESGTAAADSDSVPAAHQGGNLLDLLDQP